MPRSSPTYARRRDDVLARVATACDEEERRRRRALPDPSAILAMATDTTARVWERRRRDGDALTVSVGTCRQPASIASPRRVRAGSRRPGSRRCRARWSSRPSACSVSAGRLTSGRCRAVDHRPAGHPALAPRPVLRRADPHQRSLGPWQWMSRLPHLRNADGSSASERVAAWSAAPEVMAGRVRSLARLVSERHGQRRASGRWDGPRTVVLIDEAACTARRTRPVGACSIADQRWAWSPIALADERAPLPTETHGVLDLTVPSRPGLQLPGHRHEDLVVDRVGAWWADRLSRGLAPLRDATPAPLRGSCRPPPP